MNRRLNYKFVDRLHVDPQYRHHMKMDGGVLPSAVDLRAMCSPVEDQGQEGSCSGHAAAGAVEFLEIMEERQKAGGPQVYNAATFERVSRHFIYYGERELEGSVDSDAGATTLQDACLTLQSKGVCREPLWPYDPSILLQKPSPEAYADAQQHKVPTYLALDAGYQLRHCLAQGFPFMLGFSVPGSLMQVGSDGLWNPQPWEQIEGGHAVLCVGYCNDRQAFLIRNSWGAGWGLGGYFWMPYAFMMGGMVGDFYTLRLQEAKV